MISKLKQTATIKEILAIPLASGFAAGKNQRIKFDSKVGQAIAQIRPTQILSTGELDLNGAYGIRKDDVSETDYIHDGEVLFNNTNSTIWVGKSCVFRKKILAVCSNHVTKLRLIKDIEPDFIADVLNLLRDRNYFARLCTNFNNQAGVNANVLKDVRLPLPEKEQRLKLISAMNAARAKRRAKLTEANSLLTGFDDFLLATLDLIPPPKDERKVFAVTHKTAVARFDPHFHLPVFSQIQRMLVANGGKPLSSFAMFSDEVWTPMQSNEETFRYIEIGSIDTSTGKVDPVETLVIHAPSRARMTVREHDIIVSLTRPHHGAIAQITQKMEGCVASTGFAVIRDVDDARVLRDYLWCVLRTNICLSQMLQRASGGNYPAITELELAKVLIPLPDQKIQQAIATEARRRRDKARQLRTEAEVDWQAAKRWFEEELLGKES